MAGIRRVALLGALVMAATACSAGVDDGSGPAGDPFTAARAEAVGLAAFADCREARDYFRSQAAQHIDSYGAFYGVPTFRGRLAFSSVPVPGPSATVVDGVAQAATAAGTSGPAPLPAGVPPGVGGAPFSTTNVQETGVDEPDSIKTDGAHIFLVREDRIVAVDVTGEELREAGSLRIDNGWAAQLLLAGDRLLVVSPYASVGIEPRRRGVPWRARTAVHVVDVSDPSSMEVVETLWVEGSYVAARMVDGIARIVLRTGGAALPLVYPADGTQRAIRLAEVRNRTAIARSLVTDWIPRYTLTVGDTPPVGPTRPLTPCEDIRRPKEFSGVEMVSVITVDPEDPTPREAETVVGAGETVYASQTGLYVTTNRWEELAAGRRTPSRPTLTTQIHRFDITDPEQARYEASGEVDGHLLNQWSLSEHDGHLRVVTTLDPWGARSQSQVVVLRRRGPLLSPVGRVGGLGLTERVYAVRFMGDLAYVVTFREVDPLYVLDLADPRRPRVRGELKIPGFSSYLHPVGEGLLGIGQDATLRGRLLGVQASLFDVSDPTDPTQVAKVRLGQGYTAVQDDHRAFTWWEPSRLALFPVESYGRRGVAGSRAQALRVGEAHLSTVGAIQHPARRHQIERALVIGDAIYTVSSAGVMASDLDSFAERDWLRWRG